MSIKIIGVQLENWVPAQAVAHDKELLARSALNRCYYVDLSIMLKYFI